MQLINYRYNYTYAALFPLPLLQHSRPLTHTSALPEGHKGAEGGAQGFTLVWNGELPLKPESAFLVHHPETHKDEPIETAYRNNMKKQKQWL